MDPADCRTLPVDAEFRRHLLQSEVLRAVLVLAAVLVLVAAVVLLRLFADPVDAADQLRTGNRWRIGLATLGIAAAVETVVLVWLLRRRHSPGGGRPSPAWFRYANVAFEISLPTAAILAMGEGGGVAAASQGAASHLYFLFIGLTTLHLDARLSLFAGTLAAGQFLWIGYLPPESSGAGAGLASAGWESALSVTAFRIKALVLLLSGGVAAFVGRRIRLSVESTVLSLAERDRAVGMFGQHVSPQVAELLLKQSLDHTGEERRVCILFLDIRDFSRIAAERSAPEVMAYLNVLFEPMIRIVNERGGIVNKFLGDGFMAVFGAPVNDPSPCAHAVDAAHALLETVDRLAAEGRIVATRVGIGLHVGEAVTGNIGSAERKEYTIIGDVVNVAARIEQATKSYAAGLLASQAVMAEIDEHARAEAEDLGPVDLKGQPAPIRLYKLA